MLFEKRKGKVREEFKGRVREIAFFFGLFSKEIKGRKRKTIRVEFSEMD